jgi:Tetratricopeptide repeat
MRPAPISWLIFLFFLSFSAQGALPACARCHPQETSRFLASAMGRSLGAAESLPPGRVEHQPSGSVITIEAPNGHMVHRLTEHGLTASYPIAYQIGRGVKGRTYLVSVGDYLLESPASWYQGHGWDISPGYEAMQLIDFDRPITAECLFCHAGQANFSDADGRRLVGQPLTAITCERCHGQADEHLRKPSAKNIVNPAKLAGTARDSVCEQCHLEGETRILNPGKTLRDFQAGEGLEQTVVTYVLKNGEPGRAVTQAEELAESMCARSSAGKLWCGSCHHPHGQAVDRPREIRTVCTTCHAGRSKAAHPTGQTECVSCHMPARAVTNIAHVATTDHRIQRPRANGSKEPGPDKVVAWRDPAPELRQRDLGLAQLQISLERRLQELAKEAFEMLRTLPAEQLGKDAEALSTIETITLTSDPARAVPLARRVVELKPQCASCAVSLGLALEQSGNHQEAEQQLLRAIDLDPSLMEAYAQLAKLYDEQKRTADAADTINRFLKWNPQNIQFRLAHSR